MFTTAACSLDWQLWNILEDEALWQIYSRTLKRKSQQRTTSPVKQNVGVIREIGDGVAKVEGLTDAMLNEMLDLGHGITGLALNLEETEVGVIILGDYTQLQEGDEVRTTGKALAGTGR